jgi:hypothetical protein
VSFEIAEKMQQVWTFSPGESETPSERTPTCVSVDLLEKIPEDTQSKVSTDLLMGGVETDTHISADLLKGSVKSSRMETDTHISADVLKGGLKDRPGWRQTRKFPRMCWRGEQNILFDPQECKLIPPVQI